MKWIALFLNVFAALLFLFLAVIASGFHSMIAEDVYYELRQNHVIAEHPTDAQGRPYDVERQLRHIGKTDKFVSVIGYGAAAACIINGVLFFFSFRRNE